MWRRIGQLIGKGLASSSGEEGTGLIEVLVASAIVGMAFVALLGAVSTGALAVNRADRRFTAESLARSQMEYTKAQEYRVAPDIYDTFSPLPAGYSVVAEASSIEGRDADVQMITVTVSYHEEAVYILEGFKANR